MRLKINVISISQDGLFIPFQITSMQFVPRPPHNTLVLTHSSTSIKHLSYSRSLNSRSVYPKLTQTQTQESTLVLKPNWDSTFTNQNSNRKDDMMKVLKGKVFMLRSGGSQSVMKCTQPVKGKFKSVDKHHIESRLKTGLTRLSKRNELRLLKMEKMQAGQRVREQNQKKYLSKKLRIQRWLDPDRVKIL